MNFDIINYNKFNIKTGVILQYIGFSLFFFFLIPSFEMYAIELTIFVGIFVIIGNILIYHSINNKVVIGTLFIDESFTKIKVQKDEIFLHNKDYSVEFSNNDYKGSAKHTLLLQVALFSKAHGINKVLFFNKNNQYEYEIIVNSKTEFYQLKKSLKTYFRKYYETI